MGVTTDLPLVSVIIPAYNAERFIEQTLASVCNQTYPNLEIIIVDDGSRDRTVEILRRWERNDSRVRLITQANAGVAVARNLAISYSQGEYIAPLDADDIWHPRKIQYQVQYLENAHPSVGLVYTWSVFIDEYDFVIGEFNTDCQSLQIYSIEGNVLPLLIYQNFIGNASVPLFRRQTLEQVGAYKYNHCEDWELTLRIAAKYKIGVVPAFLVGYRQQQNTASSNISAMAQAYQEILSHWQASYQQINPQIFHWASSLFYTYLASKAYANRQHWPTIYLLFQAIYTDLSTIFKLEIFLWIFVCTLKIFAIPGKPLFTLLHPVKSKIKHYLKLFQSNLQSTNQLHHQSQQEKQSFWQLPIHQRSPVTKPTTLHQIITTKRGLQILKICTEINLN